MMQTAPLSKQATIIFGLAVVGFMAFGLAISVYRNVMFDASLRELVAQNTELALNIEKNKRQLQYYTSVQFKDKFAKENLNKINPNEHVLVLFNEPQTFFEEIVNPVDQKKIQMEQFEHTIRQIPVSTHWKLFFFYPEEIETLRQQ
jgi:cell division protein FtsB